MSNAHTCLLVFWIAACGLGPAVAGAGPAADEKDQPRAYVPYKHIAAVVDPAAKAVLMDRAQFAALLKAAKANEAAADSRELGQVTLARYTARLEGQKLSLSGALTVVSMSDRPVAVPFHFAGMGLLEVELGGKPAPLGYDQGGRLVLIVTGKGSHKVALSASAAVKELSLAKFPAGGMQFGITVPAAVAGGLSLAADGDLDVVSTVPVARRQYDVKEDRTTAELTIGGVDSLTVVLVGNGRREDERAILLGETATSVQLTKTDQVMNCVATVEILRRGVRSLDFTLDPQWTITDVACPDLVRWSVRAPQGDERTQRLSVQLRSAARGTQALHITAVAESPGPTWTAPRVSLVGAAFQRGYLILDTGAELRVRAEALGQARRENRSLVAVPETLGLAAGRLYYHWGDDWTVRLETATVPLRRSSDARQALTVAPENLTLTARFEVTAVNRDMFDVTFEVPAEFTPWELASVTVNGKTDGFAYRLADAPEKRLLQVELARPVRPEAVAVVMITMRHTPKDWDWPDGAEPREIEIPLLRCRADTLSGVVSISGRGDLDVSAVAAPEMLQPVSAARMSSFGLGRDVQVAYSYKASPSGVLLLDVSRRSARLSAGSVGLVSVRPQGIAADWRIVYSITRATTRKLQLLADSSLGDQIRIQVAGRRIAVRTRKAAPSLKGYDLWTLQMDGPVSGNVTVQVHYDRPLPGRDFRVPLIRPYGAGQAAEFLAFQASEELAVAATAAGAREIDAIDLPALPAPAQRILAAYRLEGAPGEVAVAMKTTVHETYGVPAALVTAADFRTYLGADGSQRSEVTFQLVNAGLQFLTVSLPEDAELWSVTVAGQRCKPQRGAGNTYQVALPRRRASLPVRVVYAAPATDLDHLELARAFVEGVHVNAVRWQVTAPLGYCITDQETEMQTDDITRVRPAYETVLDTLVGMVSIPFGVLYDASALQRVVPPMAAEVEEWGLDENGVVAEGEVRRAEVDRARKKVRDAEAAEEAEAAPDVGKRPAEPPPARPATRPAVPKPEKAWAVDYSAAMRVAGRYALPVDLASAPYAAREATFRGMGEADLVVELSRESGIRQWMLFGFVLTALVGILRLRGSAVGHAIFIVTILITSTLLAFWSESLTPFLNGAFYAALCLVPFYPVAFLVRWLYGKLISRRAAKLAAPLAAAVLVAVLMALPDAALAAAPKAAPKAAAAAKKPVPPPPPKPAPPPKGLIAPYEGDPTLAHQTTKVLVPYARYVELWNQAHPDEPIELPAPAGGVSLAGARYRAVVRGEQMHVELSVHVRTLGARPVTVPMPIAGLAVQEARLNGKRAVLSAGPKGIVLALPAKTEGDLRITGVTTPKRVSGRTSVKLSLPPLPAAVMTVLLPEANLVLEAPGIEGVVSSRKVPDGVEWTVPLGFTRRLELRWAPRAGGGKADRTLSASADHDVHFYHWAVIGVSRVRFTFSATDYDRFAVLLPEGVRLTGLSAPNLRSQRIVRQVTLDARRYDVVEIRLHRPVQKVFEATLRWLAGLPALGRPVVLALPRAADVGRESGTVRLHAAGGMIVKVPEVSGGRRAAVPVVKAVDVADATRPVAAYYWPYRPFALTVEVRRDEREVSAELAQLVRISPERIQLLVRADVATKRGRVYSASFTLPDGYELLRAIGAEVGDYYVQPTPHGRRLHVNLQTGVSRTRLALVLVREDVELGRVAVPFVTAIDADGRPLEKQKGRLAVQLTGSLDAATAASENLKTVPPGRLSDWLSRPDLREVRFAYTYEEPKVSLDLDVSPRDTRTRVEVFSGLSVHPTAAWYAYRLRYTITGSPIDQVSFTLPKHYEPLVAVSSPSMRSVSPSDAGNGRTRWTVALVGEVTGVLDVIVNFAEPIDPQTKALAVPRIQTVAPHGYRAVIAIQNFSRHELAVEQATRLSPLPVGQQTKLLSEEVRKALQYGFQSYTDDWALTLKVRAAEPAKRIQAIVDLMALTTVIDRRGNCRYLVDLMLQNRSEQYLQVAVPEGLTLWSAYVDGRAVKPVVGGAAAAGEVLVPLVKTSPGGLPYQVKLYLAGRVAVPLGRVARIKPPAIAIKNMDVMRTTWSLRLPEGYRYAYPGGTMAPARGRALDVASNLAAVAQAQFEQIGRFAGLQDTPQAARADEKTVMYNWKRLNDALVQTRGKLKQFVADNRRQIGGKEADKLQTFLAGNVDAQENLQLRWRQGQKARAQQARQDIANFLNTTANNPGLREDVRNKQFATIPQFVQHARSGQKERIQKQLVKVQEQAKQLAEKRPPVTKPPAKGVAAGTRARSLLAGTEEGKELALHKVLEGLAEQQQRLAVQQQLELRDQLVQLDTDRLSRAYAGLQKKAKVAAQPVPSDQPVAAGERAGVVVGGAAGRVVRGAAPSGRPEPGAPGGPPAATGVRLTPPLPHVGRATFSLPIELPEGGVVYNFSAPGGEAEVSLWAFRKDTAWTLEGTGAIVVLLVLIHVGLTLWRYLRGRLALPGLRHRVAVAVLLAVVLLAMFGLFGLLAAAVLSALAEGVLHLAGRPGEAAATD